MWTMNLSTFYTIMIAPTLLLYSIAFIYFIIPTSFEAVWRKLYQVLDKELYP